MLLVDFALAAPGTPMPAHFTTPQALEVVLPGGTTIGTFHGRPGLVVNQDVRLVPPTPVDELTMHIGAGAHAPIVRLLAPDGTLLSVYQTVKSPNGFVDFIPSLVGPVGTILIEFPQGEGVVLALAACGGSVVAVPTMPLEFADALAIDPSVCQAIVYAETGTIETTPEGLAGLAEARQFIAGVAYKRNGQGVARPKYPTNAELAQPFIRRAWDRCAVAATDAQGHDVGNCKHFVIWYSDDGGQTPSRQPSSIPSDWPYMQTSKITGHWGPYTVRVLAGNNIYVIKYCGVP